MKKSVLSLLITLAVLLSCLNISASNLNITFAREARLSFGHVIYFSNISITPERITPGETGTIKFNIENIAKSFIRDIIIEINLPAEFAPYNDITVNKIPEMLSGEKQEIRFNFISSPDASEGIYRIPVTASYINHIGDERQENETITLIVLSEPKIIAEVKSSEVYKGSNIGNIRIKLINNDVGNIKFLLAELKENEDFEIVNSNIDYIGDLDSDDFSEVSFRIKVTSSADEIILPLVLTYKDAMNKDYKREINLVLKMQTAAELGMQKSKIGIIIAIVIIAVIAFFVYRNYKKRQLLKDKHFKTKFNF